MGAAISIGIQRIMSPTPALAGDSSSAPVTPDPEGMQQTIDGYVADGTLSSVRGFESADAAAREVLNMMAEPSKHYGVEVGGNILRNSDGSYSYSLPSVGDTISVGMSSNHIGYHTHPSGSALFSNRWVNQGKGIDTAWIKSSQGKLLYVGAYRQGAVAIKACNYACAVSGDRPTPFNTSYGAKGRALQ